MRVIAGEFRSRRLQSIPGLATRPTPHRLRETLFDILGLRVKGAVFLDAYAGTGAVGIEAISRGAARAIFIERNRAAVRVLRENLALLGIEHKAMVVSAPALVSMAHQQADIVFLDPPYDRESEYAMALKLLGASPAKLVIIQHAARFVLAESAGPLKQTRIVRQGDNALSFYSPEER